MNNSKRNKEMLELFGFKPEQPVSCMTALQLFELIKFAIKDSL